MMFQDDQKADGGGGGTSGGKPDESVTETWMQLRSFIGRVERLQNEIDDLNGDKAEVFGEAKSFGLDVPTMKILLKRRKAGADASATQDDLVEAYENAMSEQIDLPLTRH